MSKIFEIKVNFNVDDVLETMAELGELSLEKLQNLYNNDPQWRKSLEKSLEEIALSGLKELNNFYNIQLLAKNKYKH